MFWTAAPEALAEIAGNVATSTACARLSLAKTCSFMRLVPL